MSRVTHLSFASQEQPSSRRQRRIALEALEDRMLLDSQGIWLTVEEIMALPTSGPAWDEVVEAADKNTNVPNISDKDDKTDVRTLAQALVGVRLNDTNYVNQARANIMAAIGTEDGGRTLALARNLVAYVVAADLVGLSPSDNAVFRDWLRDTLTEELGGRTLQSTHEDRANNWGTHAGASRAAVAAFLGDDAELARTAQVFKGYLGDRDSYADFNYGKDLSWQADPDNPVGINPKGATKEGHSIDGVIPDDMRRGGSFQFPPEETGYPWGAMQGAIVQAEILSRAGYPAWEWEDQALLRATEFLHSMDWMAEGDDEWQIHLINARYDTNFPEQPDADHGKNMGWTAWTHDTDPSVVINRAPTVDAGLDQTVVMPNSVSLNGTVTDDGLPDPPSSITTTWTKVSGQGTVSFANTSAIDTTASFSTTGTYVLRLTADDGELLKSDDVIITVHAPAQNQAPSVSAGSNRTITLPDSVFLNGTVSDDGLPNPPGSVSTTWTMVNGPGSVSFANASDIDTTASFSTAGTYVLRLTANDSELSSSDDVIVTVNPAPQNQAPTVDAGSEQSVAITSSASLEGSVDDDGLPNPPSSVNTTWTMVNGPGSVSFANASAIDTTASFTATGTYVLRLMASDGQYTSWDDVVVTVTAAPNLAPEVDAGPNLKIRENEVAVLFAAINDDGLPAPSNLTVQWTVVSGRGTVSFSDKTSTETTASFSRRGRYTLRVTVSDGEFSVSDDIQVRVRRALNNDDDDDDD